MLSRSKIHKLFPPLLLVLLCWLDRDRPNYNSLARSACGRFLETQTIRLRG